MGLLTQDTKQQTLTDLSPSTYRGKPQVHFLYSQNFS